MSPAPRHEVLAGGPLLIGHRGAAGLAPENTLPSFREAAERWAVDMIELDVHGSADGECVVIHDATVDRTTDGTGAVAGMTVEELKRLDAGYRFTDPDGRHSFRGQGITIPTLAEVLTALPDMPFTIEVKAGAAQKPMFETIERLGAGGRVVAAGMDYRDRTMFRDFAGPRSGSTRDVRGFYFLHRLLAGRLWRPTCEVFQVPERSGRLKLVTRRFIRDALHHGLPVHVWTVNDPAVMARLLEWGVDGIITDRPDLAAPVFAEQVGRPLPPALS